MGSSFLCGGQLQLPQPLECCLFHEFPCCGLNGRTYIMTIIMTKCVCPITPHELFGFLDNLYLAPLLVHECHTHLTHHHCRVFLCCYRHNCTRYDVGRSARNLEQRSLVLGL